MSQTIGVFGAGTMGTNIAQDFAMKGFHVRHYSRSAKTLETSGAVMKKGYALLVEEGIITKEEMEASLGRIYRTQSLEDCAKGCDMVMETISENRDAKRALYEQLDEICPMGVIFLSDTSALNIYELMPERRLPDTLIAHYFAPAHLIPLVELVKGEKTPPELVAKIRKMYEDMDKIPIVIEKMLPGFIINRLQAALGQEIFYMLDNGFVSAEDLDLAVKSSLMFRGVVLGVVQRMDFSGIDNLYMGTKATPYVTPESTLNTLEKMIEEGNLGPKTGKGFYDYQGRSTEDILAERDRRLLSVWKATKEYIKNPV